MMRKVLAVLFVLFVSACQSEDLMAQAKEGPVKQETVLLGADDKLLAGIPGTGELTNAQIDAWLADPKNHVELQPQLPKGLAAGAAEIQGLQANPMTRAKVELGRQLYFDTRLSIDNTVSCATCHDPGLRLCQRHTVWRGRTGPNGQSQFPGGVQPHLKWPPVLGWPCRLARSASRRTN